MSTFAQSDREDAGMRTILQLIGSHGQWVRSSFSDLPELDEDDSATLQRWRVVAGGLALILSRAGPQATRRFPFSLELYGLLRRHLRRSQPVNANPVLLNEVLHEIADITDPMTKACIKGCLQAASRKGKHAAEFGSSTAPSSRLHSSQMKTQSSSSATSQADEAPTQLNAELLMERSSALRRSVASARTDFVALS
jgi:hypothetical protein